MILLFLQWEEGVCKQSCIDTRDIQHMLPLPQLSFSKGISLSLLHSNIYCMNLQYHLSKTNTTKDITCLQSSPSRREGYNFMHLTPCMIYLIKYMLMLCFKIGVAPMSIKFRLWYSVIEADGLPKTDFSRKTTAISDRDSIRKNQSFNIGRACHLTCVKKVLTNVYSCKEVYLIIISGIFFLNDDLRSDHFRKVVHDKSGKYLLWDVLAFFWMKTNEVNSIFQCRFNTPALLYKFLSSSEENCSVLRLVMIVSNVSSAIINLTIRKDSR